MDVAPICGMTARVRPAFITSSAVVRVGTCESVAPWHGRARARAALPRLSDTLRYVPSSRTGPQTHATLPLHSHPASASRLAAMATATATRETPGPPTPRTLYASESRARARRASARVSAPPGHARKARFANFTSTPAFAAILPLVSRSVNCAASSQRP